MKSVLLFFLFAVAASKHIQSKLELNQHWENFKKVFGKVYTKAEEISRRSIFERRVANIIQHNLKYDLGLQSYRMGINEHSDMRHEEFVRSFHGYRQQSGQKTNTSMWVQTVFSEIPDQVDWRTKGLVTPVKNQGKCGSCWAFCTTGALEGQHKKKTDKLVSLSEQNLVDCAKNGKFGCDGGLIDEAFEYIKSNKGIDTEDSYPYKDKQGKCLFKSSSVGATLADYVKLPAGDEEALKQAVATIGPISVSIYASKNMLSYKGGIFNDRKCRSSNDSNHCGLAVGYGTEDGKDYWLVKNSWGTSWGEKGYIKMSRNNKNHCGIATDPMYPKV